MASEPLLPGPTPRFFGEPKSGSLPGIDSLQPLRRFPRPIHILIATMYLIMATFDSLCTSFESRLTAQINDIALITTPEILLLSPILFPFYLNFIWFYSSRRLLSSCRSVHQATIKLYLKSCSLRDGLLRNMLRPPSVASTLCSRSGISRSICLRSCLLEA